MAKTYDVAVVGATGAVGETMISILEERNFPVGKVYALASERSAGKRIAFKGGSLLVEDLATFDFSKVQIGLFSPGASVSAEYAPKAAAAGCVVIDNTSQFRYDDDIPLVVPEVNPDKVADYKNRGIIANPNCSTIQMLVALKPIHDAAGITRINVATYQAVSGTGKEAIEELATQTANLLNAKPVSAKVYPKQIAFNVLPQIDVFMDNGYTKEEMKMVWETRKILGDESILVNPTAVRVPVFFGHSEAVHIETKRKISAETVRELLLAAPGVTVLDERADGGYPTAVRVPVFFGHSEAVHIETKQKISAEAVRELLLAAPGVTVLDERADGGYPTAVTESSGHDDVYVGRIREDISCDHGINLWVVSDNVRKGAALNSVQIAEVLVKNYI